MSGDQKSLTQASHPPSIFRDLLQSDIPAQEKSMARLVDEGFTLIGAGSVRTSHVLSTVVYHVLANPKIRQTVQQELGEAMPQGSDISTPALLVRLEHLPYLDATITEGLRVANSIAHRTLRVAPDRAP
jgi:cytochrome P450